MWSLHTPPRSIVGIDEDDHKRDRFITYTDRVIKEYLGHMPDMTYLHQVSEVNESGEEKNCMLIANDQANQTIQVKIKDGSGYKFTFPKKVEAVERGAPNDWEFYKLHVKSTNYDFFQKLKQIVFES